MPGPVPIEQKDPALGRRIAQLYADGLTTRKIGDAVGLPRATVYRVLVRMGVHTRRKNSPYTATDMKRIRSDAVKFHRKGLSVKRVAEALSIIYGHRIAPGSVRHWLERVGVGRSRSEARTLAEDKRRAALAPKVWALTDAGYSTREVADELGICVRTVQRIKREIRERP